MVIQRRAYRDSIMGTTPIKNADAQRKSGGSIPTGAWRRLRSLTPTAGIPREKTIEAPVNRKRLSSVNEGPLPVQFFPVPMDAVATVNGGQRLLLAVLENALHVWVRYCHARDIKGHRIFKETESWFWSTQHDYLCSFECICEHLQLDPNYIRRGLRAWQHVQTAPRASILP